MTDEIQRLKVARDAALDAYDAAAIAAGVRNAAADVAYARYNAARSAQEKEDKNV